MLTYTKMRIVLFFMVSLYSNSVIATILYNDNDDLIRDQLMWKSDSLEQKAKENDLKAKYLLSLRTLRLGGNSQENAINELLMLESEKVYDAKYSIYINYSKFKISREKAIKKLMVSAANGHPEAQVSIANLYYKGDFLKRIINNIITGWKKLLSETMEKQ